MHPQRAARLLATLGSFILLIVFILRVLSMTETGLRSEMAAGVLSAGAPVQAVGRYTISPDGSEVTFQQQTGLGEQAEWFHMPLAGGAIAPADPPVEDLRPFIIREGNVSVQRDGGASIINGSPASVTVTRYSLSPDGKALAYVGQRQGGGAGLYIVDDQGHISWLGDFTDLDDLAWSPDARALAFIAPALVTPGQSIYQVFSIDRQGQSLRQLDRDGLHKRHPIWSPDGKTLVYQVSVSQQPGNNSQVTPTPERLFSPTPPSSQAPALFFLEQVNSDGSQSRRLTPDPLPLFNIAWINAGTEIAYSLRAHDHPQQVELYALNPSTGKTRRVYPPYTVTALDCPARLPRGEAGAVTLKLASTDLIAANVPVLLRSAGQPFTELGPFTGGSPQSRTVDIPPQSAGAVTWTVKAAPGPSTYISVVVLPGDTFALAEAHCRIENTTAGFLPDLPFLPPILPLTLAGMALCLPMLRNARRRRYWAAWLAAPVLIVVLLVVEIKMAGY